jgi:hypothetical protein
VPPRPVAREREPEERPAFDPDLAALRAAVVAFNGGAADRSWLALARLTAPEPDPRRPEHRQALRVWLNAWGCRLRYPRPGEADLFDGNLSRWWDRHGASLVGARRSLKDLTDRQITAAGQCFEDLAAQPVAAGQAARTLGPTAASKLLHALRPAALMPWDAAIAERLHGGRDAAAYEQHQRLGRGWARRILIEAGCDEAPLATQLGRPGRTLAKMLDDYCYVVITRGPSA